jgi:hypothetical protein
MKPDRRCCTDRPGLPARARSAQAGIQFTTGNTAATFKDRRERVGAAGLIFASQPILHSVW